MSGSESARKKWGNYVKQDPRVIVWVVDSTVDSTGSEARLQENSDALREFLSLEVTKDIPVLFVANKQVLKRKRKANPPHKHTLVSITPLRKKNSGWSQLPMNKNWSTFSLVNWYYIFIDILGFKRYLFTMIRKTFDARIQILTDWRSAKNKTVYGNNTLQTTKIGWKLWEDVFWLF